MNKEKCLENPYYYQQEKRILSSKVNTNVN